MSAVAPPRPDFVSIALLPEGRVHGLDDDAVIVTVADQIAEGFEAAGAIEGSYQITYRRVQRDGVVHGPTGGPVDLSEHCLVAVYAEAVKTPQ